VALLSSHDICMEHMQATQISPWVVTLDAVEPFKCDAPAQDPPVLPYMHEPQRHTYDVNLTVDIVPAAHSWAARVTSSNLQHL
jgi:fumarylacetoacetase